MATVDPPMATTTTARSDTRSSQDTANGHYYADGEATASAGCPGNFRPTLRWPGTPAFTNRAGLEYPIIGRGFGPHPA